MVLASRNDNNTSNSICLWNNWKKIAPQWLFDCKIHSLNHMVSSYLYIYIVHLEISMNMIMYTRHRLTTTHDRENTGRQLKQQTTNTICLNKTMTLIVATISANDIWSRQKAIRIWSAIIAVTKISVSLVIGIVVACVRVEATIARVPTVAAETVAAKIVASKTVAAVSITAAQDICAVTILWVVTVGRVTTVAAKASRSVWWIAAAAGVITATVVRPLVRIVAVIEEAAQSQHC